MISDDSGCFGDLRRTHWVRGIFGSAPIATNRLILVLLHKRDFHGVAVDQHSVHWIQSGRTVANAVAYIEP